MPIEVTTRHTNATTDIQDYARRKAEAIAQDFPRVEHVHVILDVEKKRNIAEIVVQARKHIRVEAAESSDNLRVSLDLAAEKIIKQLSKLREKIHDHKAMMKRAEVMKTRGVAS